MGRYDGTWEDDARAEARAEAQAEARALAKEHEGESRRNGDFQGESMFPDDGEEDYWYWAEVRMERRLKLQEEEEA